MFRTLLTAAALAAVTASPTLANPHCEPGKVCGMQMPMALPFDQTKARIQAQLPDGTTFEEINPNLVTVVINGVLYIEAGQMLYTAG